jgi:flagellar biosynthesis protein FlhA
METIMETLADWGTKTQDADVLVEYVRNALRRTICSQYASPDETGVLTLACVTLDPRLEDQIDAYIERGGHGTSLHMPANVAKQIAEKITESLQGVSARGRLPVVIASPTVRAVVWQILSPHVPGVAVLGYNEVVSGVEVESVGLVGPVGQGQPAAPREPVAVA